MIPSTIPALLQFARWFPREFGHHEAARLVAALAEYVAWLARERARVISWETGAGIAALAPCDLGPLFDLN